MNPLVEQPGLCYAGQTMKQDKQHKPAAHQVGVRTSSVPEPQEAQKIVQDLKTVLFITRFLSIDMELDEVLQTVIRHCSQLLQADRSSLFVLDRERNQLYSRIAQGSEIDEIRFPAAQGIAGEVVNRGRTILIPDCYADPRFNPEFDRQTGYRTRNLLAAPVLDFEGNIIGVVEALNKQSGDFSEHDIYLLELLATQAGAHIQRTLLQDQYREKQRLDSEMNMAREIQLSMTPGEPPPIPGFDAACFSEPCERTGGDYLELLQLADGRVLLAVGDATGHGLGAALLMVVARSVFRTLITTPWEPQALATLLNERILEDRGDERNLTMVLCILDPEARSMRWVNAGHDPPLLLHGNTGRCSFLIGDNLPLGLEANASYEESKPIQFAAGDILVIYSDELVEAVDNKGRMFGETALKKTLKQHAAQSAEEILLSLTAAVDKHTGGRPPEDDRTLIVLKAL